MNVQNFISPRIKLKQKQEIWPYNVKLGFAKPLAMNEWGSQFKLYLDFEKSGNNRPVQYHTGTEYIFQNSYMLRAGSSSGEFSFGAGVVFNMFQLDYSYGKLFDHPLDFSHRLSLSIEFGKSRDEQIRIAEERRFREINKRVEQQRQYERNQKIAEAMEAGKRYMDEGDWIRARHEFSIVLGFESEIPDALEIREAKELLAYVDGKYEEEKRREMAEIEARNAKERAALEQRRFISEQHKKALSFYEHGEYKQAIAEWTKLLDRYPDYTVAQEFIKKARVDYQRQIYKLITRAEEYGRKRKYVEAINLLDEAFGLDPDTKIRNEIAKRKSRYTSQMNFWDLYTQGRNYELQKDYKAAMETYGRALKIDPSNKEVKKHYEYVRVRANARKEPLKPEVRTAFARSMRLITQGKYREALAILEDIQKIQPYSKEILDAIDGVMDKLNQQNRNR